MTNSKIWNIGGKIGKVRKRQLHARADIKVGDIMRTGLRVVPDAWPQKHAVIIGWPGYEKKSEQMNLANKLALAATLHLSQDPSASD
jgi:hypothetical protein